MVPGGWCCSRSTSVEKRLMFSASTGVSSNWLFDRYCAGGAEYDSEDCSLSSLACLFFCVSMSCKLAAMAALRSASSSSSSFGLLAPFVCGFDAWCGLGVESCDCGTYPAPDCPLASSRLISNARFKSASKLSFVTLAPRGCILSDELVAALEPCHSVFLLSDGL